MSQAAGAAQNDTALFEEPMGISRHAEVNLGCYCSQKILSQAQATFAHVYAPD